VLALLFVVLVLLSLLIVLVSFTHLLYRESLRLRARDLPSMVYFKEHISDRIGLEAEDGAMAFSLVRHTALLGVAIVTFATTRQDVDMVPLWQAAIESAIISWLLMMVTAYIVPQLLYRCTSAKWLAPFAPVLRGMSRAVRPVIAFLEFIQSLADLGEPRPTIANEPTPTEHIDALIDAGAEEGLIEEGNRKLIHSVVAFGNKTVREVMSPRSSIVSIDASQTLDDLRKLLINEQFSRIPVSDGSIDKIIGFIHARDVFELDEETRAQKTIRDLMRPITLVPETKPVDALMREMQQNGQHMVIVVDEYGATAGLATMEDLVEEIVGEIRDEHEPSHDVTREPDGAYVVSGSYDLDHLRELLAFEPQEDTEATTVGGLVTEWFGRVPRAGESVEREGIRLEVMDANERRVDRVRLSRSENSVNA
jgi:putative hemolysin